MCRILINEDPDKRRRTSLLNFSLNHFYTKVWPSRFYLKSAFQKQIWTLKVISEGADLWHGTRLTSEVWFIPWITNSQLEQKWELQIYYVVLRIRIRDPVPFWPIDTGSGMGDPDPGWTSRFIIFWVKNIWILWCGSGLRSGIWNLFDPGSGMEKFGSGIRISDPQRWYYARFSVAAWAG